MNVCWCSWLFDDVDSECEQLQGFWTSGSCGRRSLHLNQGLSRMIPNCLTFLYMTLGLFCSLFTGRTGSQRRSLHNLVTLPLAYTMYRHTAPRSHLLYITVPIWCWSWLFDIFDVAFLLIRLWPGFPRSLLWSMSMFGRLDLVLSHETEFDQDTPVLKLCSQRVFPL